MLSLARKRSKRTVADERITYKVFDFSWSFSPLFNWLRLFGIALNESTEPVNVQKNLSQGFYILVPICTLAARIYTILDTTCQLISFSTLKTQGVATEITTTLLWSQSLRLLTQHLALITSQIAIFIVSFSRWGLLVSCFRRLERSMKIGRTCYIQLRRACTIGLLWLLLELGITIYTIIELVQESTGIDWKLSNSVNCIGRLGITGTLILFTCLCWISSSTLQLLIEDVERTGRQTPFSSVDVKRQLLKWRRNYRLICQFTEDHLNRCFGWILLFMFTKKFVSLICFTFQVYMAVFEGTIQTGGHLFDFFVFYFENAIYISLLTAVCYRIRIKVYQLGAQLRHLQFPDPENQMQMDFLVTEVIKSCPTVTAAGFFDIDLKLIPMLVGTTLTYLLVLCQFQSSENH